MFLPQEVIRRKRDGHALSADDIRAFVRGFVTGEIPEYQMSALCMAIYFSGCSDAETAVLLEAVMKSGVTYDWSVPRSKGRRFVDKHSTGGVGDKTSLVILPLLVADGLDVPMVSGRGLGHTGGTLDKLESMPGFRTRVPHETFLGWMDKAHGAFGAQTDEFVPADKKLYALRDVTATVESMPLIVASIMSKKLGEGLDALVLDVKAGSGAFMGSLEKARALAQRLVAAGNHAGCPTAAAITNMDEPLGRAIGNSLEVAECLDILVGAGPLDTRTLSIALAAKVACLARKETSEDDFERAATRIKNHLTSGRAYEIFVDICVMQGAARSDVERQDDAWTKIGADEIVPVMAPPAAGESFVEKVDSRELGLAVVAMGGGRVKTTDTVNPGVGLTQVKKVGEPVGPGEPLCFLHYGKTCAVPRAEVEAKIRAAYTLLPAGSPQAEPLPLIFEWL